jgi:hypothetical protein
MPLLACTMACQPVERTRDCHRIGSVVNPVTQAIDTQRKQAPADPKTYRTIAAQYEWLANAIGAVHVRPKRFEDALGDYQRMLHEARHDASTYADALEAKDTGRMAAARTSAARTVKHESNALARLDGLCRGR